MFDTILFDLGGVLTPDPWQAMLLTPGVGLADSLGLSRARVEEVGESLWPKYSRSPEPEAAYWAEFGAALGVDLPPAWVDRIENELLVGIPRFPDIAAALDGGGTRWGFISDNTSFWYPKQVAALGMAGRVRGDLEFLSFGYGLAKTGTRPTLFEAAAAGLDPARTLVIDDRAKNIAEAGRCGFGTECYSATGDEDGSGLLELVLSRTHA